MKNLLCVLVMAAMMMFVPSASSDSGLSISVSQLGDVNVAASLPPKLPSDTVIRFPDPNFEAVVREIIGKTEGDIIASDVAGITYLYIVSRNIADLSGIEYFSALEELTCGWNELTKLDVSQNTKLIGLDCQANQLTTLDLSNNTMLEYLQCWGNQLTSLNVREAIALEILRCAWNQLKTLDTRQNIALRILACNGNQLTSLDVSNNFALTSLWCDENNFPDKSAIIGLDENRLEDFVFGPEDY